MNEQAFEKTLVKYENQIREASIHACVDVEEFKEGLRIFAKAVGVIVDNAMKFWNELKEWVINRHLDLERIEKESRKKRLLYKLNFDRPKIKSQVIDRKPQRLIKKVIY